MQAPKLQKADPPPSAPALEGLARVEHPTLLLMSSASQRAVRVLLFETSHVLGIEQAVVLVSESLQMKSLASSYAVLLLMMSLASSMTCASSSQCKIQAS
eukprot:3940333-Rhodomonas_salina.3